MDIRQDYYGFLNVDDIMAYNKKPKPKPKPKKKKKKKK